MKQWASRAVPRGGRTEESAAFLVQQAVDLDHAFDYRLPIGGTMIRGPKPVIDVEAHGASSAASASPTENTAAFVRALAQVPAAGATLYLPGLYTINDTLTILDKQVDVVGAGMGVSGLKLADNTNKDLLVLNGSSAANPAAKVRAGIRLAHLRLDGNAANNATAGTGIRLKSGIHVAIEGVHVVDFREHGIWVDRVSASIWPATILIGGGTRVEYNLKNGIFIGETQDSTVLDGCWINDNGTTGSDFYNVIADGGGSFRMMNCYVWQGKRANIRIHAFQQWQIIGCYILSAPRENIIVTGTASRESALGNIVGNHLHSASEEGASTYAHIQLGVGANNSCSNVAVVGNTFSNPGAFPTLANVDEVSQCSNNVVVGNTVNGSPSTINIRGSGSMGMGNVPGNFWEDVEIADPAAPGTNRGRLYFKDNGAGKTQLAVRFNTGAVQVVATEP